MTKEPDYSSYSIEELRDALSRIDRDAYPLRVEVLKQEIEKRVPVTPDTKENPVNTKTKTVLKEPETKLSGWFTSFIVLIFGSLLVWDVVSGYATKKSGKVYLDESPFEFKLWIMFKLGLIVYIVYLYFENRSKK